MATRFVILDLETTGLHPEFGDKIIEIGLLSGEIEHGQIIPKESFESLINPNMDIDETVTMITGIKNQDVKQAPTLEEIRPQVIPFLKDSPIIVGHNIQFDIHFLQANGFDIAKENVIDTIDLASLFEGSGVSLSLESLTSRYDIPHHSHRAMGDVLATKELFSVLYQKIQNIAPDLQDAIASILSKSDWTGKILFPLTTPQQREQDPINIFLQRISKKPIPSLPKVFGMTIEQFQIEERKRQLFDTVLQSFQQEQKNVIFLPPHHGKTYVSLAAAVYFAQSSQQKVLYITSDQNGDTKESRDLINAIAPTSIASFQDKQKIISLNRLYHFIINQKNFSKDETLFVIKILLWLSTTEKGYLQELSFPLLQKLLIPFVTDHHGEAIKLFKEPFRELYEHQLSEASVVTITPYEYFSIARKEPERFSAYSHIVFENGSMLEEQLLYAQTNILHESRIIAYLDALEHWLNEKENVTLDLSTMHELKNTVTFLFGYLGMYGKKRVEEEGDELLMEEKHLKSIPYQKAKEMVAQTIHLFQELQKKWKDYSPPSAFEQEQQNILGILQCLLTPSPRTTYLSLHIADDVWIKSVDMKIESFFHQTIQHKKSVIILSSPVIDVHKRLHLSDFGSIDLATPLPSQIISYITEDMRIANSAAYTQELTELISQLVFKKRKNMVVIVSNVHLLDQMVTPLSFRMKEENIPYLAQKLSGGEYKVLEIYTRLNGECILFCTLDFLQKISPRLITADVFVLQKLPFAYTNGLVDTIRKQQYQNSFMEYALPKSLYRFEELIGTIAKVKKDNKKIIILDNKIVTEQYGAYFRALLPNQDNIKMIKKHEMITLV